MPLSRDSRTEKKLKALRRAEYRLKQRFEYIDWEEDYLFPEIDALKSGRPVLGLDAGTVFDLQVGDGHKNLSNIIEQHGSAAGNRGEATENNDPVPPDEDPGL